MAKPSPSQVQDIYIYISLVHVQNPANGSRFVKPPNWQPPYFELPWQLELGHEATMNPGRGYCRCYLEAAFNATGSNLEANWPIDIPASAHDMR